VLPQCERELFVLKSTFWENFEVDVDRWLGLTKVENGEVNAPLATMISHSRPV
jgi:hypothetical protein